MITNASIMTVCLGECDEWWALGSGTWTGFSMVTYVTTYPSFHVCATSRDQLSQDYQDIPVQSLAPQSLTGFKWTQKTMIEYYCTYSTILQHCDCKFTAIFTKIYLEYVF